MLQEYEYEFAEFIYYTPGPLDKEGNIWPVRGGRTTAKPNYRVGPKRIECFSLHFVQEGKVRLRFGGEQAELEQGDLFCLFPERTYHYERIPSDQTLRMSWLALDGSRTSALLALAGLTGEKPFRRKALTANVRRTSERAIDRMAEAGKRDAATAMELQGLVCRLFAELIRDAARAQASDREDWLQECKRYMELHAAEGITVQQVADYAGVHRSYFSQAFTNLAGISPLKFLQKIRMEKAKQLLHATDASITEIALSLGYPNLYAFTRAYKTYYKEPPVPLPIQAAKK